MLRFDDHDMYTSFLQVYLLRGYASSLHATDCEKSEDDSDVLLKAKNHFYKTTYFSGGVCIGCQIRDLASGLLEIETAYNDCIKNTLTATVLIEAFLNKEEGDEGS